MRLKQELQKSHVQPSEWNVGTPTKTNVAVWLPLCADHARLATDSRGWSKDAVARDSGSAVWAIVGSDVVHRGL